MKKPAIPSIGAAQSKINAAVKDNLEIITGRRSKIVEVSTTGLTGNDLILANKINEILERLQG